MTRVAILPVPNESGSVFYRAVTGDKHSQGRTAGEALDALTMQLTQDETSTIVIVQNLRPDQLFDEHKQKRLAELMERWREARDKGETLPSDEQNELDALVEAELNASANRASGLADELER